jgi:flagellar export protein FliJ
LTVKKTIKRFERVRDARESLCDKIKLEMADVREREKSLSGRSEDLSLARASAVKTFIDLSRAGGMGVTELWSMRTSIDSVEENLRDVRNDLEETRQELDSLQGLLEEKHRDVKAVENLVGSMRERYRKECLQAEQTELDDIASMKFFRARERVR